MTPGVADPRAEVVPFAGGDVASSFAMGPARAERPDEHTEVVEASLAAVRTGTIGPAPGLSRRHRWEVLSVDVQGDHAAVAVARRGKRKGLTVRPHRFALRGGRWEWEGDGSGLGFDEPTLPGRNQGSGAVASSASTDGTVSLWHLTEEVAAVRVDGRTVPVAAHGFFVAVERNRSQTLEALDDRGEVLGLLEVSRFLRPIGLPLRIWLRGLGRSRTGWINRAPRDGSR